MKISVVFTTLLCAELQLYVHVAGARLISANAQTDDKKSDVFKRGTVNAIGDFKESLNSTTYVDKTMMIEDFFKNSGFRQYHLVTCPHKFGKTTNLDMLKRFFEGGIKVEENNEMLSTCNSENYQLFHKSPKKLKIAPSLKNSSDFYRHHFQQYSTIHVTFKVTGAKTYEEVVEGLWKNLKSCFERHERLYNTLKARFLKETSYGGEWRWEAPADINQMCELMHRVWCEGHNEDDLVNGLFALSNILIKFYSYTKIFLFVDDYDDPVINAIENNLNVKKVVQLIDRIFSTLFNDHHRNIQHAFITGTLNVLETNKFNFIRHWSFLDNHHFAKYFGLTEDEVDQLLDSHGTNENDKDMVKKYYSPYMVSRTTTRIYHPFSITHYLAGRGPNDVVHDMKSDWSDWTETSLLSIFWQCFKKNEMFGELSSALLTLDKVTFPLKEQWSKEDLEELKVLTHGSEMELTVYRTDLILSYMFHNGFLSHSGEANKYRVPDNVEIRAWLNQSTVGLHNGEFSILDTDQIRAKLSLRP